MSNLIYFLKKGFENTKDISSFIYFLSEIKEKITSDQSESIAISIFSNTKIEQVDDDISIFFNKIKPIIKEETLIKEKILKIILKDFLKKYMNFFETENNKSKADNFLYLYLNLLPEEKALSIFYNKEIIYKMIEADFSLSLNFFDKKGLNIFEDENNINAINDKKWLIYIKNKKKDINLVKSNNDKYEKAWENLYFKNERVSLKDFLNKNINEEDIRKANIRKYFNELNELLNKPDKESLTENFLFSQQDGIEYKDNKGRNSLFLSIYNNKSIIKKIYRKSEVKERIKKALLEKDNDGRNVLPYCLFNDNDLSNLINTLLKDISPTLDSKGKGFIEQFIDLKKDVKNNSSTIYHSISKQCTDEILIGNQDSLLTKLIQIMKDDKKALTDFLPFFRSIENINSCDERIKTLWLVAQIEDKYSLSMEEEVEKILRKGIVLDADIFEIDMFNLIDDKAWPQYFKDKVIVSHNENVLRKKNQINEGKFDRIILNRI